MTDLRKLLAEATPGPWAIDPHGIDDCLGDVWTEPGEDEECICENATVEDARLIALAPDLAAALIRAEEALAEIQRDCLERAKISADGQTVPIGSGAWIGLTSALSEISALTGGNDD